VFALLGTTVDSIQTVGQGKHLKIRLSKGPNRFDAIFFSVSEDECDFRMGDRVDAAFYLQVNTFRGQTTLQLQLIDLRASLAPSRHEAEALDLIRRCREEETLTPQEEMRLRRLTREQFAEVWRMLERRLRQGKVEGDALPLLRSLADDAGGNDSFLRSAFALAVFSERGLLFCSQDGSRMTVKLTPVHSKVDLTACPYLKRLNSPHYFQEPR